MTNPEHTQPDPESQLNFAHFAIDPLQVLNAHSYTREALAARQKELAELHKTNSQEFYNQIHNGTLLDFSLSPGIQGLRLPTDGDALAYLSTFDEMSVKIHGKASYLDIVLNSSEPACQDVTCKGCAGCLAPCFIFDPSGSGFRVENYGILEFKMTDRDGSFKKRYISQYGIPENQDYSGWDDAERADNELHKQWFEAGIQALVDKICTQEIIDFNDLLEAKED